MSPAFIYPISSYIKIFGSVYDPAILLLDA